MSRRPLVLATAAMVLLLPLTAIVAFLSLPSLAAWGLFVLAIAQHAASYACASRPTIALLLIAAAAAGQALITGLFFLMPSTLLVLVALCIAARQGSSVILVAVVAVAGPVLATITYATDASVRGSGFGPSPWLLLILFVALCAAACASGWLWRSHRVAAELMRERDLRRHREREEEAIEAERRRISRDLHDILAHSLAVVIGQIRVARFEPDHTATALATAEATARSSLAELRRTLGLLRDVRPSQRDAAARIDIRDPGSLAAAAVSIGVPLHRTVRGTPRPLDERRRMVVAWFVREALTNAAKHAPGSRVDYVEAWESDHLEISLGNDPATGDRAAGESGFGLRGMTERLAEVEGTLSVHSAPRFMVAARLPYSASQEEEPHV